MCVCCLDHNLDSHAIRQIASEDQCTQLDLCDIEYIWSLAIHLLCFLASGWHGCILSLTLSLSLSLSLSLFLSFWFSLSPFSPSLAVNLFLLSFFSLYPCQSLSYVSPLGTHKLTVCCGGTKVVVLHLCTHVFRSFSFFLPSHTHRHTRILLLLLLFVLLILILPFSSHISNGTVADATAVTYVSISHVS